ncbi:MAG TPA: PTS mannitol transporter subunit IICBA [Dermatophilaceae bacterium]|nr:PTS mannitol transporter subunit IICBA [Dermatophilaceae bacterium]HMT88291.1 PTS mannitol transporter subunit IICBA [Dermatophilaceae bacterium]
MASTAAQPRTPDSGRATERASARVHVQKFGTFLSNMVMPNIGAFIAWGLITALFIKSGWLNMGGSGGLADDSWVAQIGGWGKFDGKGIVGPMITYLLPILIGYTGGKMVYETRGGVVGAIATMGVISGTSIPMFMGAMVMGPLGGWTMKKIDSIWDGKIKPGFEMLVNNFSAGIWGLILACAGFFIVGPKLIMPFADVAGNVVKTLVNNGLLPLTSVFIEPAKILFLNNAINHGVLTPLGTNQSLTDGKSILFLLEANPGPGLGLLLAFMVAGKGMARASAPGAALIHFVGGIHEIYFPYVLAKPRLIAAMILGGMTGVFTNVLFGSGLRAPAAPGSILAVLAQTPGPSLVGVILSVVLSATVTFLVAAFLLRMDKSDDAGDLSAATASMEAMKGKKSVASAALTGAAAGGAALTGPVRSIVFACDAGMGSSAMGASVLRRKIQDAGITGVTVVNKAISNLTDDVDLLVTHQDLATRAAQRTPSAALYTVDNFMASPTYDQIVADLQVSNAPSDASSTSAPAAAATAVAAPAAAVATDAAAGKATDGILTEDLVRLSGRASTRDDAIREVGAMLVGSGAVDGSYVDSMLERERSVSTYMGNQLAIPHGTNEAKAAIHRTAMAFIRYPNGIDWNGKPATFVIGIAGAGDDHLTLLSGVAKVFLDKGQIAALTDATTPQQVLAILNR